MHEDLPPSMLPSTSEMRWCRIRRPLLESLSQEMTTKNLWSWLSSSFGRSLLEASNFVDYRAMNLTRFMAKVAYPLKEQMLHSQVRQTIHEYSKLQQVCIIFLCIYAYGWITTSIPSKFLISNLKLLK